MTVEELMCKLEELLAKGIITKETKFNYRGCLLLEEDGTISLGEKRVIDLEKEAETFRKVAAGRLPEEFIEEQVQQILNGKVFKPDTRRVL